MNRLPSTSSSVAPQARRTKSGEPPTDWNARTGLSTPPGSTCRARSKRALLVCGLRKESRRVAREIRDDHVGAGAADGGEGFHHRARLVDPAVGARRLDHRELSADLV